MAQCLMLLLVLFFATVKSDHDATVLPLAEYTFTNDSAIEFPAKQRNMVKRSSSLSRCLDEDKNKNNPQVFCTQIRSYPNAERLEESVKKKYSKMESFFGDDYIPPKTIAQSTRTKDRSEGQLLCQSRVRIIYPQSGINKNNDWLMVLNAPNYKQGIRIEECVGKGEICGKQNGISLPKNYVATCEQQYIYRNLIGYKNGSAVVDAFKIPSCCKCVLRKCI